MTKQKLTPLQRDALERIRNTEVQIFTGFTPRRIYGGSLITHFDEGTIRRLEVRGLAIVEGASERVHRRVRITDAGRRALGDWAAGRSLNHQYDWVAGEESR